MKYLLLLFLPLHAVTLQLNFDVNYTITAVNTASHHTFEDNLKRAISRNPNPCIPDLYSELYNKLDEGKVVIFPSFLRLLDYLDAHQIDYHLSLRTFGLDLPQVTAEIEKERPGFFQHHGHYEKGILHIDGEEPLVSPGAQYDLFTRANCAIHDDFFWWHEHGRLSLYGKPFLVDPCGDVLTLFFDDHVHNCSIRNIVSPIDIRTGRRCDYPATHVNTIEAILNDNYFIELLETLTCTPRAA